MLFPLGVFAATRLITVVFVLVSSSRQVALPLGLEFIFMNHPMPAHPGYWDVVTNWDGQWYESIATHGYQVPAPGDPGAANTLWAWQFPPLYPMTVRVVMEVTQLPFGQAAALVSLVAGAAAMVIFYRLLEGTGGKGVARLGVVLLCCFTSAPLFQFAYSESLALLLLVSFFALLRSRRYGWMSLVIVALSFTRLITPPLAVVLAVHLWQRRKAEGPLPVRDLVLVVGSAVYAVVGSVTWLLLGSAIIGPAAGLARTESYRNLQLGWFTDALNYSGPLVFLLLCLLLLTLVLFAVSSRSAAWGPDLRVWSAAYPVFLCLVTIMQPGMLRYLLLSPTLPLMFAGGVTGGVTRARLRVVWWVLLVALLLASQLWFVSHLVMIDRYVKAFGP